MTATAPPVLRSVDRLDSDWLANALATADEDRTITAIETQPIGTGQMSRVVRVTPTYARAAPHAPASVVVKLASEDPAARGAGHAMGLYESEVRFYREIAPLVDVPTPGCFAASIDPSDGAFTLVLEDRPQWRPGDMIAGSTVDEAALALDALAGLQAPTWNDTRVLGKDWLSPAGWRTFSSSFPASLEPFLSRFGDQLTDEEVALCRRVVPQAVTWLDAWDGPNVVQHGDYRVDNMLFDDADRRLSVFDWQTARVGPPLVDAGFYLGGCLDIGDRREHETHLLREYHRRLSSLGVTGYSWNDCRSDYVRYAYYGLIGFVGSFLHVEVTPRGEQLYLAAFRKYAQQVLDLES